MICVVVGLVGLPVAVGAKKVVSTEKPVLTPAFKWAESDEALELWVKFAHKLDAPSVAFEDEDVSVTYPTARQVTVEAENAEKKFVLDVPLLDEVACFENELADCSWEKQPFGILLKMKKVKEGRWKTLTPKKQAKSVGVRVLAWHERQLQLDNEDEVRREEATAWWRSYAHKCEVCREMFFSSFGDGAFSTIKELRTYRDQVPIHSESYNASAYVGMRGQCDRLTPMVEQTVKIKGSSTGSSKWAAERDNNPFNADAKRTCEAMVNYPPVVMALLDAFGDFDKFGAKSRDDVIFETRMEALAKTCVTAAKACPKKMTPLGRKASKCTACNSVVSIADAKLRVRSKEVTVAAARAVLEDMCGKPVVERLGDASIVFDTCERLAEDFDEELATHLVQAQDARAALDFCNRDEFCPKKEKKTKGEKAAKRAAIKEARKNKKKNKKAGREL